jgi:hypothetical protein
MVLGTLMRCIDLIPPLPTQSRCIGFGADELAPKQIVFVDNDQVAVAGTFRGTIDFGDGPTDSNGSDDGFLTLLVDGDASWTRGFGGVAIDGVEDLTLTPAGDLLVTGFVANEVDLGAGPQNSNTNSWDWFWGEYKSSDGGYLAAERTRPSDLLDDMQGMSVAIGSDDQVVFAGSFEGNVSTDGADLISEGDTDGFVIQRLP